jgi:autotransporter-associated beta strand protein
VQNIANPLSLSGIIFAPDAGEHYLSGPAIRLVDPQFAGDSLSNASYDRIIFDPILTFPSAMVVCASAADQFIGNPLEISKISATFAVTGTGALTLAGEISGPGGLQKLGSGTLILSNNESYTGGTLIMSGVLALDATGQITQSDIGNQATFIIMEGDHTVKTIWGNGTVHVLGGTLTATSICQDTLIIGAGSSGDSQNSSHHSVPEPAAFGLLAVGILSMLARKLFGRNTKA